MKYRFTQPYPKYQIGQVIETEPDRPIAARLIADGILVPVDEKPKPKAEKRETKPGRKPKETK